VLEPRPSGDTSPVVLYRKKAKRRKRSAGLRGIERVVRRVAQANQAAADEYLDRHERANRKKKDGWLRKLDWNLLKTAQKGHRKLRRIVR